MEQEFDLEPRSKKSHVQGSLKVKVRLTAVQVVVVVVYFIFVSAAIPSFFIFFISFHIFMEGGPSVITDLQGARCLHYTYITSRRKIITNMTSNYND